MRVEFGLEVQFGEMSADRRLAILLEGPMPPVPTSANVPIKIDATSRATTGTAKAVTERTWAGSFRILSGPTDQIVGAKATARLVPPRHAAERKGYRLVVSEKTVLGRWRRSVANGKRQVSKRGFRRNSKSL
jgi:hypothetical protein